jgi:hypothetical protein
MKLAIIILCVTAVLIAVGIFAPGHAGATVGISSGSALPGLTPGADTPEQAINSFLSDVQHRDWDAAHALLANSDLDESLLVRDMQGANGSLRSLSGLQSWEFHPLHETNDEALIRTTLHWSTAVGPMNDVRDLKVARQDGSWRVNWTVQPFPSVPAQVVPVNYLRWDLVSSTTPNNWGEGNVDSPHVRIVSMNAVPYQGGSIVMGEIVNEDTIPAFVNVNATLVGQDGRDIDEESSFDKISHVLLPKQVSPYRIDFPAVALQQVKSVRMDANATLVPASADPVIGVMDQKLATNAEGASVLQGELLNQTGQVVNIPHVIAGFYDNHGRVIWVSDGYVDRALFPQTPEPFAVDLPNSIAGKVQSFHVVVNQYSLSGS